MENIWARITFLGVGIARADRGGQLGGRPGGAAALARRGRPALRPPEGAHKTLKSYRVLKNYGSIVHTIGPPEGAHQTWLSHLYEIF